MNFGQPLLSKFLPPVTVLRNPCKGLTLTRSGPVLVALVDPTNTLDVPVYLATIDRLLSQ